MNSPDACKDVQPQQVRHETAQRTHNLASHPEPRTITAYIDYKSPYAYLAVDPTIAMADELGVEVDWRPFTLDIPSYLGSARLDKEGKVVDGQHASGTPDGRKHEVRRVEKIDRP